VPEHHPCAGRDERYSKSKWKFGDSVAIIAYREASGETWERTDQTQTVELVSPPARAAEVLGVDPDSHVYARARLVKLHGKPTDTLTSYYRPQDVEGTPLVDPTPGPAGRGGGFAVLTLQGPGAARSHRDVSRLDAHPGRDDHP
jgi:GntR family transcriptional regulator